MWFLVVWCDGNPLDESNYDEVRRQKIDPLRCSLEEADELLRPLYGERRFEKLALNRKD